VLTEVVRLLEDSRHTSARAVNAVMTATYWEVGRRIVEGEQSGDKRAGYGKELLKRLSSDLTIRFGRGFSQRNLEQMRLFYLGWRISQILSAKSHPTKILPNGDESLSSELSPSVPARRFPLPWSHYVRLMMVKSEQARGFYEAEALRGGWSVRQLNRQINSQFYERTALSCNKAAMLRKGSEARPEDAVSPEEEIKDPFVLEFLGLRDEYSESELERALISQLENFLLEHLANANNDAHPGLMRIALKLATGAGKTTVMAMLIAWQTVNAVPGRASRSSPAGFWSWLPA
jgi:hypothetical protein